MASVNETKNTASSSTPEPEAPSLSSESEKRRMKYMRHKYTAVFPAATCVFRVPNTVKSTKPEAYLPQLMGLGPYHHFRPEVQLRATKKRAAIEAYVTKSLEIEDPLSTALMAFNEDFFVDEFEPKIRSSYDQYIDLDEQTLTWITMLDVIVLLHFLDIYLDPEQKQSQSVYPDIEKLVPDLFMLENQLPVILINRAIFFLGIWKLNSLDSEPEWPRGDPNVTVRDRFFEFCRQHSPLEVSHKDCINQAFEEKTGHLLHCMYRMIMENHVKASQVTTPPTPPGAGRPQRSLLTKVIERTKVFAALATDKVRELVQHAVEEFNYAVDEAKSTGVRIPGNIQKVSQILGNLDKALQLTQSKSGLLPLTGKLEIPSVSRLSAVLDVEFKPLPDGCGIENIDLKEDGKGYLFNLPRIKFGPCSDVILRNLVAYESIISRAEKGSTRLRDFVDLMSSLIRSEKDVKLLKDAEIIQADEKIPDSEIARIFRGFMNIEEKPDAESKVHQVVQKANNNYSNLKVVKYGRSFMNHYAAMLKLFRTMFLYLVFVFLAFQSFCDVYDCKARPNSGSDIYLDQLEVLNPHDQAHLIMLPRKLLLPQ